MNETRTKQVAQRGDGWSLGALSDHLASESDRRKKREFDALVLAFEQLPDFLAGLHDQPNEFVIDLWWDYVNKSHSWMSWPMEKRFYRLVRRKLRAEILRRMI